jgi:hypothetical protein
VLAISGGYVTVNACAVDGSNCNLLTRAGVAARPYAEILCHQAEFQVSQNRQT